MSASAGQSWTLTARWLFPVDGRPLEQGLITIAGDRIVAVEPAGRGRADIDLGNMAVLPGLVNAHTHLDLGSLRRRVPPSPAFTAWLRAVVEHRRRLSPKEVHDAIGAGISECLASGTTLLGDISSQGMSWPILTNSPLRAVVFYELLGLPRERARQAWHEARTWLESHPASTTCRPGLSPHAPYSARASLFRTVAVLARRAGLPVAIHLAESPMEQQLLDDHSGPFVDFLSELNVWDAEGLIYGFGQLLQWHTGVNHALFIHGNYLPRTAVVLQGGTVVVCPRTHAAFGHAPHPLPSLLARGVRVALGTDSLASNPDLDVLAEARFLHRSFPGLPGAMVLRMATLAGAEALGWSHETGSLTPGKSADLVALPVPDEEPRDAHDLVFDSTAQVKAVLIRGQWVTGERAASAPCC
jgi:cytosine/adenosine deaminase-related metal-dependent hydrolase